MKDVEFDIVNKDDKSKKYTIRTDENGVAITPVLSNGTYVVTEVRTKDGYILDKTEREVNMTGEPVILNIPNKRKTVDFTATKKWTKGNAGDYKQVSVGLYVRKESEAETDAKPVTGSYTPTITENDGVYTYEWKDQLPELDTDEFTLFVSWKTEQVSHLLKVLLLMVLVVQLILLSITLTAKKSLTKAQRQ